LERVMAIRAMRDLIGMSLSNIRQELLVAPAEKVRSYAAKAAGLSPEVTSERKPIPGNPGAALDYLRALRSKASEAPMMASAATIVPLPTSKSTSPGTGFEALERRLVEVRSGAPPARKSRVVEWIRLPVTPDVELAIRGRLDDEQRARLERCADLIRDILFGRD